MLRVTNGAVSWIAQLLDDVTVNRPSEDVLRLSCSGDDQLAFTLTGIQESDQLYRLGSRAVLAVTPALASEMSEVTIERDKSERGAGVIARREGRSRV